MELASKDTTYLAGRGNKVQQINVINGLKIFPRRGTGQFNKQIPNKSDEKQENVGEQACYRCRGKYFGHVDSQLKIAMYVQ